VDETHLERLVGLVEATQEPDLLRLLHADVPHEERGAKATVEAADPWAGLPEDRVVAGDRQVADKVQDVAAADCIARPHRHARLREPPDLDVQVADVEPPYALLGDLVVADVAVVAADPLVASRAEGLSAGAGEDDGGDPGVVARSRERVSKLRQGGRPEGV